MNEVYEKMPIKLYKIINYKLLADRKFDFGDL